MTDLTLGQGRARPPSPPPGTRPPSWPRPWEFPTPPGSQPRPHRLCSPRHPAKLSLEKSLSVKINETGEVKLADSGKCL